MLKRHGHHPHLLHVTCNDEMAEVLLPSIFGVSNVSLIPPKEKVFWLGAGTTTTREFLSNPT